MELSLARPLLSLQRTSETFGSRMTTPLQTLRQAVESASKIESSTPRPKSLADSLHTLLDTLDDTADALSPSDVLFHHISLLSIVASALACVSVQDAAPSEVVTAAKSEAEMSLKALRAMTHPKNIEFADSAEGFLDRVDEYVGRALESPLVFVDDGDRKDSSTGDQRGSCVIDRNGGDGGVKLDRGVEETQNEKGSTTAAATSSIDSASHTAPHLVVYRETVLIAVDEFENAAVAVGGAILGPASNFCEALRAVYAFIVKASNMEKAPGEDVVQDMLGDIIGYMGKVAELGGEVFSRDDLFYHVKAVEDAVGMVSWIVAESKPTSFVTDAEKTADYNLNQVLKKTKKTIDEKKHKDFVKLLKKVFKVNVNYIKEYHTMGLRYGLGMEAKGGVGGAASSATTVLEEVEVEDGETYVTAFQVLIDGPLAAYVAASKVVGGEVAEQAESFAAAMKAEKVFLGQAYEMTPPEDMQPMLAPIAKEMSEVSMVVERVDPHGPFSNHCNALSESVAALGWVAVDEMAARYVSQMAEAGQFFVNRVKKDVKGVGNENAHLEWAASLEAVFSALTAYVKEYHTQKLIWNPPKVAKIVKRVVKDYDDQNSGAVDYVTAFKALLDGPLRKYIETSEVIGGEVKEQATAFAGAWKAEAEFLAKAISMPHPQPEEFQAMLAPIGSKMGEVAAVVENVDPRGPLAHHCNAIGESVGALGWVAVEEKAVMYIEDMKSAGKFFLDKLLIAVRKGKDSNAKAQREWVTAVEDLFKELKEYVREYHIPKLVWNPPKAAKKSVHVRGGSEATSGGMNSLEAFNDIICGPLEVFIQASNELGGEVAEQAGVFAEAWKAEEVFLAKASKMPEPDDFQDMLTPIATKMGEVGAIVEKVGLRGTFSQHCSAVGESVGVLGWVAVDEKATAYVGNMADAGQFYLNSVKMGAKKTDKPDAHRKWATSLETLFGSLKAYVKEYHTQKLVWNSSKAGNG